MTTVDFPACCTAIIVRDFGESDAAEGGNQVYTPEKINNFLEAREKTHKAYGKAMVVATTNSEQKVANGVLLARGYKHSKWMSKPQHKNTKVRLWYKILQ